jgi:formylglycine-generating enzyme required for sulfatase activity
LVCLESLNLISFPRAAKIRVKRYELAHGKGPLFAEVQQHMVELGQRIESLLMQHEEHRVQLEQVDAHNRAENFRSAAKLAVVNDAKSRFSDLPYGQAIQQTQAQLQHLKKIQEIHDLSDTDFKQRIKQGLLSELTSFENGLKTKDSELGRECLLLADVFRQRVAKLKRSQRNQWLAVVAVAVVVLLGVAWFMNVEAEAEKKRMAGMAEKAGARAEAWKQPHGSRAGEERVFEIAEGVKLTMCWIPAGEFVMGSFESYETPRPVKLTQGFWLSQTGLTQAQWRAVMGNNPSSFQGDDLPVESVSWNDICGNKARTGGFLGKLNQLQPEGGRFDLPTGAQWEYACRAGKTGDDDGDLGAKAWYSVNSDSKTHPVGQKQSNAWGLYDMQGNVWEWCADWKADYSTGAATDPTGPATDPTGPASGSNRVIRGGSWDLSADGCRVALRLDYDPSYTLNSIGFRVARSSVPQ